MIDVVETMIDLLVGGAALAVSAVLGWPLAAGVLRVAAHSQDAGNRRAATPRTDTTAATPEQPGPEHGAASPADGRAAVHAASSAGVEGDGPTGQQSRSALRGGTWIGILERAAITACLIAGYPAGIAFVIAVKGLGRYPELREHPGVSERFVIGTLASMLWAVAVGAAARGLILA